MAEDDRIEIPESSKFDGEQKTTREMVEDKVSEKEKSSREASNPEEEQHFRLL